tara:strand:+ start:461 stop:763 length:303 start_codon:yes stop_codon:yes gene_type:complete
MSIAKISWSFDAETEMMTILKVDGIAFPTVTQEKKTNKIVPLRSNSKAFYTHLMKYRPGTTMTLDQFCNNKDYYGVMYTIVDLNGVEGVDLQNTRLTINV